MVAFTRDFFEHSRQVLRTMVEDTDIIVVTANGLLQQAGDSTFPFRQDSSFWYLTGIDEPDITLVMDKDREYLIVPGRSVSRQAFDGSVDDTELTKLSGITTIMNEEYGWQELTKRLNQATHVATLQAPPAYVEQHGMYTNPARAALVHRLKDSNDQLQIVDIRPVLASMRVIKRPVELAAIQRAIDITLEGISAISNPKILDTLEYEYEIEAELTRSFRRAGAGGHAFSPIVAAGERACTLHNVSNQGALQKGQLIVMDVGADFRHYAADITRTVPHGNITQRQRDVHTAVLEAQDFALSLLKPGALLRDNEQQIETFLGKKLQELGLLKKADHEGIRKYYPHSASHFLGLDVHDVGDYSQPLVAGMVVTCEPGIYIPEEGIGVRIEDDILITETGNTNLSHALDRKLA